MEAATEPGSEGAEQRELTGEKATRIVDAMRACVAEHGVSGATFEQVSRQAGVSRGLLHYYFGTKERLLVEVVRRDSEMRIARLDEPLAAARSVDDVIQVLVANLEDILENDPGFFVLLFDLFTAGRRNPEVGRELAALFGSSRRHVGAILAAKDREGVLALREDAESVAGLLLAIADGVAIQALSDDQHDHSGTVRAAIAACRPLLGGD